MSRLDEAVAEIEKRYRCVMGTACALSPTMEGYVVVVSGVRAAHDVVGSPVYLSAEEAIVAWCASMDVYLAGKTGTLYWRIVPEIDDWKPPNKPRRWCVYARLLVTDKPPLTFDQWHGDDDREPMMSRAEWSRRYFPPPAEAAPAA